MIQTTKRPGHYGQSLRRDALPRSRNAHRRRSRRIGGTPTGTVAIVTLLAFFATGCVQVNTPPAATGRPATADAELELFVVHGLAETLSTVSVSRRTGRPQAISADVVELGAVPNHITTGDTDQELLVTLSGENRVLVLDETTLSRRTSVSLDAGTNPMESVALGRAARGTEGLVATTALAAPPTDSLIITDRGNRRWTVRLNNADGTLDRTARLPVSVGAGPAPQAVLALPVDGDPSAVRVIAAATAFDASRPKDGPFGTATLSAYRIRAEASTLDITPIREDEPFAGDAGPGLNPTAMVVLPAAGSQPEEIVVVGSGINYVADDDGTIGGADDGTLVVLDAATMALRHTVAVGGSPGSTVVLREADRYRLFLAGPEGIRTVTRDDTTGWNNGASTGEPVYRTPSGELALIAGLAVVDAEEGPVLVAADYWNSRLLFFAIDPAGTLRRVEERNVSHGPQGLLIVDEGGATP